MGRRVVIVDSLPSRRAELAATLGLAPSEVREVDDLAKLPAQAAGAQLAVLDLGSLGGAGLEALRCLRGPSSAPQLPLIALVPGDRPDLRLAAIRAGADEATPCDTPPRVLRARLRSLLRQHGAAADLPDDLPRPLVPGLAEGPAAFLGAAPSAPGAAAPIRLGLLGPAGGAGAPLLAGLLGHPGCDVVPLSPEGLPTRAIHGLDLVVVDALAIAGDLAEGAPLLATLAELRTHRVTRDAATLLLVPGDAMETAALALDLGAGDVVADPAGPEEVALRACALLARKAQDDRRRDRLHSQLRAAVTDPLTGLHNLHHADPALRRMAEGARRDGGRLAVMMLDIDHFKSINDRYGHATGNQVLVEVARRLRTVLRPGDLMARIGGEEFLAALPGATLEEGRAIAERLRLAIADRPFVIDLHRAASAIYVSTQSFAGLPPEPPGTGPLRIRVTLSIGVASASAADLEAGLAVDDLLARADAALYAAKAAGRDAVVTAAPQREPGPAAWPDGPPLGSPASC